MARNYADAIASLNTLQSNFAIVDAIRKSGRKMNEQAIPEMIQWCKKIGYDPREFDRSNAIHIAGTKGKGSTAAFVSSILTQYLGQKNKTGDIELSKIGLYTSPHLRFVRERIQINGEPLSEEQFTKYFFETWDRLERAAEAEGSDPHATTAKPVYFRFLTLMAFHTYMSEGVNAAIIECGIGGAYDSTNVLQQPTVTGITSLGIDHVGVLGATLPEIAWHKAGVMKPNSTCYTPTSQHADTKPVLEKVAGEQKSGLVYTDVDPRVQRGDVKLGLEAEFQKTNASLAVEIAKDWLTRKSFEVDETRIIRGLENTRWSGRCETRREGRITWCIDGGHTLDSIAVAGKWFAGVLNNSSRHEEQPASHPPSRRRFLIFNQQTRDASSLATALHTTLASTTATASSSSDSPSRQQPVFDHAIFTTNTTYKTTGFRPDLMSLNTNANDITDLKVQHELASTWETLDPSCAVSVVRTIEEAVDVVRQQAGSSSAAKDGETDQEVTVLVTGSLHLVGGFLEVLEGGESAK